MRWVLEKNVFRGGDRLREAALALGHGVRDWSDDWWDRGLPPCDEPVVFHGSLGNADRIAALRQWRPGAFCRTASFHCSAWYPAAAKRLLHARWEALTVAELVRDADAVLDRLGGARSLFVRPDSPLKPFSGRVLSRERITLAGLDHGFYYDDVSLRVVVAPVRAVAREWRYVVVQRRVVAGSGYEADGRTAVSDDPRGAPWRFAEQVAAELPPPEDVYVLDVCEADGELHLLELNPFSGADLYACNGRDVVHAVAAAVEAA